MIKIWLYYEYSKFKGLGTLWCPPGPERPTLGDFQHPQLPSQPHPKSNRCKNKLLASCKCLGAPSTDGKLWKHINCINILSQWIFQQSPFCFQSNHQLSPRWANWHFDTNERPSQNPPQKCVWHSIKWRILVDYPFQSSTSQWGWYWGIFILWFSRVVKVSRENHKSTIGWWMPS